MTTARINWTMELWELIKDKSNTHDNLYSIWHIEAWIHEEFCSLFLLSENYYFSIWFWFCNIHIREFSETEINGGVTWTENYEVALYVYSNRILAINCCCGFFTEQMQWSNIWTSTLTLERQCVLLTFKEFGISSTWLLLGVTC